jgi:adenylate cyclase
VKDDLPCRLLDSIPWRGGRSIKVFTTRRSLTAQEKEAWGIHNLAMTQYFERGFSRAAGYFRDVLKILPDDPSATLLMDRCAQFMKTPPPSDWTGTKVMQAP